MQTYNNSYKLNKEWHDIIGANYVGNKGITDYNIGTIGYVNSVMRNITEDVINTNSELFNEIFPSTAKLPSTIRYYANRMGIVDTNAIPSKMEIMLFINENYIKENARKIGEDFELIISDDITLFVDNIPFILDYPIKINGYGNNNNNNYKYITTYKTDVNNPMSDISNPYIKNMISNEIGSSYLVMMIEVRQIDTTEHLVSIFESNTLSMNTKFFDYRDQFCGMEIIYTEPNGNSILMEALTDEKRPLSRPYYYFEVHDDNVEISFSKQLGYFTPQFNSTMKVKIFTCIGKSGNFTYTGEISMTSDTVDLLPNLKIKSMSDSVGGVDKTDIDELRHLVNNSEFVSNNIIRQKDLQNYFKSLKANNLVPIKKRDDIERVYSIFATLINEDGSIIHSNTLDCRIHKNEFDSFNINSKKRLIKAGRCLAYNEDGSVGIPEFEKLDDYIKEHDNTDFVYTNPYLMIINSKPHKVNYYMNSVNDDYLVNFNSIDYRVEEQFLINRLNIYRNAFIDNEFTISLNVMPISNIDMKKIYSYGENHELIDCDNLKVLLLFKDEHDIEIGYIRMTMDSTEEGLISFKGTLNTDDYINDLNKVSILNSIRSLTTGELIDTAIPINNTKVEILVCVDNKDMTLNKYNSSIDEIKNKAVANIYDTKIELIKDLNRFTASDIKVTDITEYDFIYTIKDCPLVRMSQVQSPNIVNSLIRNIMNIKLIYERIRHKLENNFSLDYKFFNNYGNSKYFQIGNNLLETLNKTNISIKLYLKIFDLELSETIIRDIKSDIITYLSQVNDNENIYISDLLTILGNKYSDKVSFFIFDNMNDYNSSYQRIENISPDIYDNRDDIISANYIPETINIHTVRNEEGIFEPDITLEIIKK